MTSKKGFGLRVVTKVLSFSADTARNFAIGCILIGFFPASTLVLEKQTAIQIVGFVFLAIAFVLQIADDMMQEK